MTIQGREAVQIVALDGEWDLSRGLELRHRLNDLAACPLAIIDLSDCLSMDANCLTMLLRMRAQRAAKGYPPALLVLPAEQRRLLGPLDAEGLWMVFDSIDEALSQLTHFGNLSAAEPT